MEVNLCDDDLLYYRTKNCVCDDEGGIRELARTHIPSMESVLTFFFRRPSPSRPVVRQCDDANNLSLESFGNRIFVRGSSDFYLKFSVRKPNCSNSEAVEHQVLTIRVFLLSSVSLVQVNLFLKLFENRIFVGGPNEFYLEFFVRKPNCSNSETFENRGLTVLE